MYMSACTHERMSQSGKVTSNLQRVVGPSQAAPSAPSKIIQDDVKRKWNILEYSTKHNQLNEKIKTKLYPLSYLHTSYWSRYKGILPFCTPYECGVFYALQLQGFLHAAVMGFPMCCSYGVSFALQLHEQHAQTSSPMVQMSDISSSFNMA